MDLETFIEQHDEHIPSAATSYRLTGTIFEGGRLNDFIYQFQLPNKMHVELKLDRNTSYHEGFDGEQAWEMHQYLLGDPADTLEFEVLWPNPIRGLDTFQTEGHEIEFHGRARLHEEEFYHLDLTIDHGPTREYYYDTETLLPRYSREVRKLHPSEEPKEIETSYDDYRQVDGAWFAFHVIDTVIGEEHSLVDIQWSHAIVDPSLEPDEFEKLSF